MPTYTYQCPTDGTFEIQIPVSEHERYKNCPTCGFLVAQVIDIPGRAIGVEERSDTRYWRDAPTRIFMNDKRKRKT